MALVKTGDLEKRRTGAGPAEIVAATPAPGKVSLARRNHQRTIARQQKAAERIGAATEQLASGMTEAAAAAEELRSSLEQIASGAEEAAGAAQQSSSAIDLLSSAFARARSEAESSRRKTEALQDNIIETARQLDDCVSAIGGAAERHLASIDLIASLESQVAGIQPTTQLVADISDRTNLLALNAAIEAARAGDTGSGFTVVADEVRTLAETAERSAREIGGLAGSIMSEVTLLGGRIRAAAAAADEQVTEARAINGRLATVRGDLVALGEGSQTILTAAIQADIAAREAGKGAELVASAAEEQASAVAEAQRAVQQQAQSLDQSQQAAQALAQLAEAMQGNSAVGQGGEQVGSAAEELSATVQELSGAAGEILLAIDQISRGAETQSAATQQANAAIAQIETGVAQSQSVAEAAARRIKSIGTELVEVQAGVRRVLDGFASSIDELTASLATLDTLEQSARSIEKSIDRIMLVALQTSMLSVSGSVEAARAGQAGRGFAIVSADIRKLAQDAAENIEGVKDVVRLMQFQVAAVRRHLELVATTSAAEHKRSRGLTDRMNEVETEIAAIGRGNEEILAGAGSALSAVREVLAGTQQIASAAHQAGAASAAAASAAHQQARGAEDLAAAIEEVASLADELQIAG